MKLSNPHPALRAAMSRRLRRGRGIAGSYRLALAACASVLVPMGVMLSIKAASFYWTGDAPGGAANWSTTLGGSNWSSSPSTLLDPQIAPTSSDDVFFVFSPENPSPCTTVLGADFSIKGLTFNAAAITPVTIGGANTLTVGTDGITVNVGSASNEISANVKVGAVESWANNALAATTFTVSGTISGTSALTLQGTGSIGTASGSFVFTHANTYSGALTLLNANTSLTLSGNGTLQSASSITLNGGTNLTLDNSATVASRLGGAVPVISNGGTITLIGSATSPVADTIGILTLGSGATNINVTPDLNTPHATSLTINGLARSQGGTVNFASTGTVSLPGQPAGLIGPWATIGDGENSPTATGTLEFATVSGGNVTALGAHNTGDISTWGAADNVQVNATQTAAGDQTIGTLYMTTAGILNLNAHTLTISSGGVIANGGTGTYIVNGNQTMKAASVLGGSGFSSATSLRIAGSTIKAAPGVPAFIFNIAGTSAIDRSTGTNTSTGVLQVNASLADNPQVVTGSFTSTTVNASNIVTLTSGTTGGIFPGATVTGLAGETGTQVVTSIIDATHFTVGVNAGAAAGSGTPVFTDHTGLTKTGGGILDLANGNVAGDGNAFAGFITINAGVVLVRADTDFGVVPSTAVPNFITLNGGEIRSTAGFTINASRGITIGPQGGTLNYDGGGTFSATSKITGPGGMTFESVSNSGATTFNLSATSGFLSYQGPTTLVTKTGSNITLPTPQEFPSNTPLTIANYQGAFGTVNFNNTAQTVGSLASDTGVGTITNINGLTIGGTAASPVSLTASYNGTISGTDLTKNGGGTQTLSRANTYSGTTTINGGVLLVTNTSGSATGTSNVVVANGGTLGGSGMIGGGVTVNSGGTIAPATGANSPSTLQLQGGLTISSGSSFNLELGTPNDPGTGIILLPTSDNIFVNGVATFSTGVVTINVTDIGIPASVLTGTPATYQFITALGGAPIIDGVTFHVNESPQFVATVISDDANQSLDLVISQNPNPSLTWFGSPSAGNGPWNTTTLAWINTPPGSGAARYQDGALLTFDNTPGTNAAITLASNVAPGSMTFANGGAVTYTFSGTGQITGSTGFTTTGLGTINFNNHNTFTGAATINAGSVVVGAAGTLADASYAIASGATLTVNGSLTGANAAISNAGTFAVNSGGSVAATTTLANAGTANFSNASQTLASLSGAGPVNLTGTALTLRGGTYDGVLTGTGASSLTIAANTVTLSNGGNNYGNTTITGGTLAVTNASGSATGTGLVDIKSTGTLTGNGFITGDVTVESGGTLAPGVTTKWVTSGTLTFNNVFVNGGAKVAVGVGTVTSAVATNALTLQSGAPITLILNPSPGAGAGTFPVFTSAGLTNNNANPFTVLATGVLNSPEVTGLTADINGNEIDITISVSATPLFYTGANGTAGTANWDFVTPNWSFNGSAAGYLNGMNVVFDDTHNASGNNNVAVATGINPGSLTITGTQSYTFSGAGFGGSTGLVINSSGTITLGTGSTFTGPTSITGGGTVVIPDDTALGAAPASAVPDQLTIGGSTLKFAAGVGAATAGGFSLARNRGLTLAGNATLDISAVKFTFTTAGTSQLNSETAVVYNGVISGTGNLTIVGSGGGLPLSGAPTAQSILDLGAVQTYLGDTTINNAIVQVNSGVSGANNGAAVVNVLPTTTTLNLINGGTFNVDSAASTLTVAGLNGDSTGRYGTTNTGNSGRLTLIGSGNYNFAGTIGAMEVAGKNGADLQVSLVKTGTGTQILSGNNTYTGVTTVSGGNLVVTGSISGSTATVSGTGIISGTGTIGAVTIQSGGAIEPGGINAQGAGVGGMLNSGSFTLQSGGNFTLAVLGGGPGIAVAGQLNVTGTASLAGGNFADAPLGLTPADIGDTFLIILDTGSPVSGIFGNDPGNGIIDLADGAEFHIYYDVDPASMTTPNTGNDVAVQLLVLPIPEPGSLASVLSGLGMLASLQRFRRRR